MSVLAAGQGCGVNRGGAASSIIARQITPFSLTQCRGLKQKHKKFVKLAKGFIGRGNRCYKMAKHRVDKARQYAYRDRKVRKRDFRTLWIQRINAASRIHGVTYNSLIHRLAQSNIHLNRKALAELAFNEPLSFRSVVEVAKASSAPTKA
jgi:large subunit ribosomal protein L20